MVGVRRSLCQYASAGKLHFPADVFIFGKDDGMAKMVKCKTCGADIAKSAKICPHCGAKNKKGHPLRNGILAFLAFCLLISLVTGGRDNDGKKNESNQITGQDDISADNVPEVESGAQTVSFIDASYNDEGHEWISAELLYEYGRYMEGHKVVTVIQSASDAYGDIIHATTEGREDALTYSINCNLNIDLPRGSINEGDLVTVAGTVGSVGSFMSTVPLENCTIIGMGEALQDIKNLDDYQRSICEQYKQSYEDAIIAAENAERDNYISECVTVAYSDVERNPDTYKGTKIRVSGSVEQVIEGWFNSVTLRLDSNGDTWVITYTHKEGESRILDGDYITVYGECDGVTSVTNILGAQMTYPSMKMVYHS